MNTTFTGNLAAPGSPDVEASTRVTTLADSGPGSLRQAICNAAARPGADTITFDSALSGGVIRLTSAQLDLSDPSGPVTITAANLPAGVTVSGEGARRGFRVATGSTVALDSLTVSNGVAAAGTFAGGNGGGAIFNQGRLDLRNCTLVRNSVPGSGAFAGALANYGGDLRLTNCTLALNSAWVGGAIYNFLGTCSLSHCTIASNSASVEIGGVATESGPLSLQHTLLANPGRDLRMSGATITSGGYNLVSDGTGSGLADGVNGDQVGTTATPINTRLGALRNNGGPTPTMAPLGGSPAIDAGNPLLSGLGLTDQRGLPRVANGRVDIGAVEIGLRAYYTFDSFSAVDALGGSVATYQGSASGPWWNSDHRGQGSSAIALNDPGFGTDNYYQLTTPGDPTSATRGLGLKGDFTISVWVLPRVLGGWKIVLGSTTTPGVPGTPVFGFLNNNAYAGFWQNELPGRIPVAANQWLHLAWSYNAHGGQMALYVNGQLDNSAVGRTNTTLDADLLLGFSEALDNSYFQGFIDEFAIFNEALSASQIAALAAPAGIFPIAPLPQPVLSPGLASATCGWNVREIYTHTNDPVLMPYDLPSAEYVAHSTQFAKSTNYHSRLLNRYDPGTHPSPGGFFGGDWPFASDNLTPQGLLNGDDNYFVLAARALIQIAEEDDYTFGFAAADGARLRIFGAQFTSSTALAGGNPAVPAHRGDTLSFPAHSANSLTLGVIHLRPGNYDVEFISWELGGGGFAEVFAARGAQTALDGTFALLGPTLFATHPRLSVELVGAQVRLSWTAGTACDRLEAAPSVTGPWTDVPGAVNGQLLPANSARQFFRVAQ